MSVAVNESLFTEGAIVAGIDVDILSIGDAVAEVVVESLVFDVVALLPVWAIARVHVFTSCTAA